MYMFPLFSTFLPLQAPGEETIEDDLLRVVTICDNTIT